MLTTHGAQMIDLLEQLEAEPGHELWAEEEGREQVQHWDCHGPGCTAVLERRFADGAVWGSALTGSCPVPAAAPARVAA